VGGTAARKPPAGLEACRVREGRRRNLVCRWWAGSSHAYASSKNHQPVRLAGADLF
jgi:hypothetical protein